MAPESRGSSVSTSTSNQSYHEEDGSRKGRKLSNSSQRDSSAEVGTFPIQTTSRIKPKATAALTSNAPVLEATEISNGKVVDAKSSFATLGVRPWLLASLSAMAIYRPTAIQKGCIPAVLDGSDVIGGSRTGSGKTIAFVVPILQRWAEDSTGVFAVVLTPTRELALQILEQFKALSALQNLRAALVTGGSEMRTQALALADRPHIVIATPGRLADHIETSGHDTIRSLRRTHIVVLDEADRLLAAGPGSMLPDVETCLGALPPGAERQTLLFTATVTPEVMALKFRPCAPGKPPVHICEVDTSQPLSIPETLKQTYLQVPVTYREAYLHILLQTPRNAAQPAVIVFCNRTATADLLERLLFALGHPVVALHSGLPQRTRTANLARFRAREARVLVATDVASRGLDLPSVGLVVNYDVPRDPADHVHRVGRTARAGRKGEAVTLVGQRDAALVLEIEARTDTRMVEWAEEGVNVETRVVRDALKVVGEKKREVLLDREEGRDVRGHRVREKKRRVE